MSLKAQAGHQPLHLLYSSLRSVHCEECFCRQIWSDTIVQVEPATEEQPQEEEEEQEAAQVEEEVGEQETEEVEEEQEHQQQEEEVQEEEEEKYIPRLLDSAGVIGMVSKLLYNTSVLGNFCLFIHFYFCSRQCNTTIKRSKP